MPLDVTLMPPRFDADKSYPCASYALRRAARARGDAAAFAAEMLMPLRSAAIDAACRRYFSRHV